MTGSPRAQRLAGESVRSAEAMVLDTHDLRIGYRNVVNVSSYFEEKRPGSEEDGATPRGCTRAFLPGYEGRMPFVTDLVCIA